MSAPYVSAVFGPSFTQGPQPENLSIERIYDSPSLSGPSPRALRFAPSGKEITFLKGKEDNYRQLDLWIYDIETGTERILVDSTQLAGSEELSEEEKARRERKREFSHGIVEYVWARNGNYLLFPINGKIYHCDVQNATPNLRCISHGDSAATDVKCSPKGRFISFVRDQDLYTYDLQTDTECRLTNDGGGAIKNGMAEYIAQEEMGRYTGYWWSPDESHIAYLRVDESPIQARYEVSDDGTQLTQTIYPFTGTANASVRLFVQDLESKKRTEVPLGDNKDIYIPRVTWSSDGKTLLYQQQDRSQKHLELFAFDRASKDQSLLLEERAETWINLHDDLRCLNNQQAFIWASESSGFKHLYLHEMDGSPRCALTAGQWPVHKLLAVDEEAGWVYYDACAPDPLQKQIYRAALDGSGCTEQLSTAEGWHDARFSSDKSHYIDLFSNSTTPPQVSLCRTQGGARCFLEENRLDKSHPYFPFLAAQAVPEFGHVFAEDGTKLFYKMIKPFPFDDSKRYPVIVRTYGGPHARVVKRQWDGQETWSHIMANKGFVVFSLDNRGSSDRGKAFEEPIHRQLGEVELRDQLKGTDFLRAQPFVDPERIGIFGWSYGGYMTLMGLTKAADVFKAGVSVAPVTDWKLYDTHYTERYLDHPQDNPDGYDRSNVFEYAGDLKGRLLLVHGEADDNVLYSNTRALCKKLQGESIAFEMMAYPGAKHSIASRSHRIHLFNKITDFFVQYLQGGR